MRTYSLAWARFVATCVAVLVLGKGAGGGEGVSFVVATSRDDGPYAGVVTGVRDALGNGAGASAGSASRRRL